MGWTSLNKTAGMSVKDFFCKEFNSVSSEASLEVIDCSATLSEAYLAIEVIRAGKPREVFAMVCLIHYNPKSYHNFSYKDMEETAGPYYYNCPERILNLLTPTTNQYAMEWRRECRETIEQKKARPSFKVGDILEFKEPISFSNAWKLKRLKAVNKRKLIFKSPDTNAVRFKLGRNLLNTNPYIVIPS